MGGNETIDTDALRAFAGRFDTEVGRHLDEARTLLAPATEVEYASFTTVGWPLATASVEGINFALRDLETKREMVSRYVVALKKTADDWDAAEHASTVHPVAH